MKIPDPLIVYKKAPWWQCPTCDAEAPARWRWVAILTGRNHWYWTHGEGKK